MSDSVSRLKNRIAYDQKSIQTTRLLNQINNLKNKLRGNRNQDNRAKIQYKIQNIETDITKITNKLTQQKKKYSAFIEQMEKQIQGNKKQMAQLKQQKQKESLNYDSLKKSINQILNLNKSISLNIVGYQKQKRDYSQELARMDRMLKIIQDDIKHTIYSRDKYKLQNQQFTNKIFPIINEKLEKLKSIKNGFRQNISSTQKQIQNGKHIIKGVFNEGMDLAMSEQNIVHRHLLNRQKLKDLQNKQRDLLNKQYTMNENIILQKDRNELLQKRINILTKEINEQIKIETFQEEVEAKKHLIQVLKAKNQKIIQQNKRKHANNNKLLQYLESMTKNDQTIIHLVNRQQNVRQMKNKCLQTYQSQRFHQDFILQNPTRFKPQTDQTTKIESYHLNNPLNNQRGFSGTKDYINNNNIQSILSMRAHHPDFIHNNNTSNVYGLGKDISYVSKRENHKIQIKSASNKKIYR